jgi:electron-transferring-flavoprotein dehydrogenase
MRDHGNYVISINRFVKWLGGKVEEPELRSSPASLVRSCLFDGGRVTGVRTDDKGVDKEGQQKSNFEPGYDLNAKVVILAEGHARLADQATHRRFQLARTQSADLRRGRKRTVGSSCGPHRARRGHLHHGLAADFNEYGGAWIYGSKDNIVSLGFVTGLDYADPRVDPQRVLQDFKQHPFVCKAAGGRQDGSLWREVAALRRLVGDSAAGGRWLDDARRLRRLSQFAAAEGNSSGDQERHAGCRNCVRCADGEA